MRSTRSLRKGFAVAVTAALAFGGAIAAGSAAYAVPDNINPDTPRSLTIHKHETKGNTAAKPDGTGNVEGDAIADVQFTLYEITNVDLNTHAGWETLSSTLGAPDAGTNTVPTNACTAVATNNSFTVDSTDFQVQEVKKLTTLADGTATWGNRTDNTDAPKIAAYLVCETDAPASVVTPARPFVITVPFPYEDAAATPADPAKASKKWLYDVHAYPKNELGEITKENVKQEDLGLGSNVKFTVTSSIPALPEGYDTFTHYVVSDKFDDRLSIALDNVVESVSIDNQPLTKDVDYEVKVDGQTARVHFINDGLTKLKDNQGKNVVVVFSTTVTSIGNGTIENDATYSSSPDKGFDPSKPGTPSEKVRTKWGDLRILKFADNDESKPLRDAKFQIFEAKDPYPTDGVCKAEKADAAMPITVDGKNTFESDENGLVKISGLFVSSMYEKEDASGAVVTEGKSSDTRCYVLEETEPPVGYIKADVQPVKVTAGETQVDTYDLKVENVKPLVPGLPLTGATGKLILLGSAGLLFVAAGGLIVATVRRRNQA
ncbi:SpaH/EbpB family LPXTG-anchored major pilin [Trueperella bialowiezensis]|uniref:Fimbrial subunit type 1 n=1 Tax=Trueperella bialowiezensis TaxID=312285 RepID=A0A3S4VBS0_9ACTO|nr:SpaH/EbpB family LPXTG-anchored major pilin [Trueperella bialowiezensis]VEI14017.1 Fimbrial subunit type 1 precursor [Trueperella bialowiezensis]